VSCEGYTFRRLLVVYRLRVNVIGECRSGKTSVLRCLTHIDDSASSRYWPTDWPPAPMSASEMTCLVSSVTSDLNSITINSTSPADTAHVPGTSSSLSCEIDFLTLSRGTAETYYKYYEHDQNNVQSCRHAHSRLSSVVTINLALPDLWPFDLNSISRRQRQHLDAAGYGRCRLVPMATVYDAQPPWAR